jgi:OOP family OmpA-OmpF porin
MKFFTGLILTSTLLFFSCATPKQAVLESTNTQEVLKNIESLRNGLLESNADILSKRLFENGSRKLNDGRDAIQTKKNKKEIMINFAQSKEYFLDAEKYLKKTKVIPESVFNSRQRAIDAKLLSNTLLKAKLNDLDDNLIDETDDFTRALSSNDLSTYHEKYLNLEVEAVQHSSLGVFRGIIKKAEGNDADEIAPRSYQDAISKIKIAENLIHQSPRNSSQFEKNVESANKSVKLLDDVISKLIGEAKGSSEATALKLVYQDRKLGKLSKKVGRLKGSLQNSNYRIGLINNSLDWKNDMLLNSRNKIRFQNAMDQVRKSFSENEASVYQQGDKLIIRIKEIGFKSGSAAIPTDAMDLLAKINWIIKELNPEEVMVEGHTDATGPRDKNMMLSSKRALAVKEYLSTLDVDYLIDSRGFGESKPIANNQSKNGRLLNRRVDIVVRAQ